MHWLPSKGRAQTSQSASADASSNVITAGGRAAKGVTWQGNREGQLHQVMTAVAQQALTNVSARAAAGKRCGCHCRLLQDH